MNRDEAVAFLNRFRVPGSECIYVLGSFSSHVTLYSQQIRALNFIYALSASGETLKDRRIAVIGGGAAGLSVASAAAWRGANVVLLECLSGPMELQRNNRQRWLHPHIYDWPDEEFKDEPRARLPLLDWTAGYAESVAIQIENAWRTLVNSTGRIVEHYDVHPDFKSIHEQKNCVQLTWNDSRAHPNERFDLLILAVGFGLEEEKPHSRSYWSEDSIDGDFRRGTGQKLWLVSGSGDGALTDLMRLCIRRFRHSEVATMFASLGSYDGVKIDLRRMHADSRASNPDWLSKEFENLPAPGFEEVFQSRLRKEVEVVLNAERPIFGPGSSILNRLVTLVLMRIGAFHVLMGRLEEPKRNGEKFDVFIEELMQSAEGFETPASPRNNPLQFDHVLTRHSPKPSALAKYFASVDQRCESLKAVWKAVRHDKDETRRRLWPTEFYETQGRAARQGIGLTNSSMAAAVQRLGVCVGELSIHKQLKDDGSSVLRYEIKDLSIFEGELSGLAFYYTSDVGHVGEPALDEAAKQLNHSWIDNTVSRIHEKDFASIVDRERDRARRISGVIRFGKVLTPLDAPISFGLSVTILNSDALSSWEFEQFYAPEERLHFDRKPFDGVFEYLAGVVWFPIEKLNVRISLPACISASPVPTLFRADEPQDKEDVVRDSILQLAPPNQAERLSRQSKWSRQSINLQDEKIRFSNPFAQTWELSVTQPPLASCYSLDWAIPASPHSEELKTIESDVARLRRRLIAYGNRRRLKIEPTAEDKLIRSAFEKLDHELRTTYRVQDASERFDISVMTYNDQTRRLTVVEGAVDGGEPDEELWNFWLPFGFGLAGSCLKKGDRALVYFKPRNDEELDERPAEARPEYYVPLPNTREREVLVSMPVYHTDFRVPPAFAKRYEWGRQIVAVVNIGSTSQSTKLLKISTEENAIETIAELCQSFSERICGRNTDS